MTKSLPKQIEEIGNKEAQEYFRSLADELNCCMACATDVWYLRQRSRWTQELENELIRLYAEGNPPNICEFG
jgi:hypothetical protein